jgi:hypothetical protein
MRIAIVIADTYGEPFETIKRETKNKVVQEFAEIGVDVFYFKGKQPKKMHQKFEQISNRLRYSNAWPIQRLLDALTLYIRNFLIPRVRATNSQLSVNCPEGLRFLGVKDLAVINYLHHLNYEIIYKTTLSSVVPTRNFMKWTSEVRQFGDIPYFGGTRIDFASVPFVSGANLMLNQAAVKILLKKKWKWNHGELDDVAIGKILNKRVKIIPIKSINVSSVREVTKVANEIFLNLRHIRCKSQEIPRNDLEIIYAVLERIETTK